MRFHRFFLLAGFTFSLIIIITATIISRNRISRQGSASGINSRINPGLSETNSYIYTSPVNTDADGESQIRITIYVLDGQGIGVPGQELNFSKTPGVIYIYEQNITDGYGRAIVDAVSRSPGNYTIRAYLANGVFLKEAVISFQ